MVLIETIISKRIIKPSSPTPYKFKTHKLSSLDQIGALVYIPLIFFYKSDESNPKPHAETSQLLKQSLSRVLTVFYPFAGTIHENSYVDCDDTGVEFVEARVHARLEQVTEEPQMEELKKLAPVDVIPHNEKAILLVKLSFFDCGGIALGVGLSHKVGDFASLAVFMDAWAATCREDNDRIILPSFDLSDHFPSRGPSPTPSFFNPQEEKITSKRLVFDREKLEKLKQQAASSNVKNPTRVEALSIFLWQQFIEAHKTTEKTSFAALHAINLRPRTIPPIPDHTIGNCMSTCYAIVSDKSNSSDMLTNLRDAIRSVDDNFIKKVVNSEEYIGSIYKMGEILSAGTVLLSFTSIWRFPVYGVDFGWGKPVWVCTTTTPYQNTIILMSTPSEDGIEALINMPDHLFQMVQANYTKLVLN